MVFHDLEGDQFKTRKAPRTQNGTAHSLPSQARNCNVPGSCFFSPCAKPGHINSCPILEVLRSVLWDQYDLLQVLCYLVLMKYDIKKLTL